VIAEGSGGILLVDAGAIGIYARSSIFTEGIVVSYGCLMVGVNLRSVWGS
jgi:hypothetical protein